MCNKQTEQAAISHVMALERAAGPDPKGVRSSGLPYDVERSPPMIEVKVFSRSARSEALPLEQRQVVAARANPEHYYLYVVDNLTGFDGAEIGVRILRGEALLAMIERSQPQFTYWPIFRAAEYDQAERLQ
ncbi:protein NO VEIN domain-containing protein [Streptomyces sp. NPDC093261]|uniref:protein NO VEIN domain-containing protein n=1 Tax=Streptomyces sp. NPDC093261 TaxID=3366037 RepID=UPI00382FD325